MNIKICFLTNIYKKWWRKVCHKYPFCSIKLNTETNNEISKKKRFKNLIIAITLDRKWNIMANMINTVQKIQLRLANMWTLCQINSLTVGCGKYMISYSTKFSFTNTCNVKRTTSHDQVLGHRFLCLIS